MRAPRLDHLEENIKRIPGVQAATVMGAEAPSEIHIVASSARSPKQLVRDIQSLASAGFGFSIDHRIVSIVRLEEASVAQRSPAAATTTDAPRPAPTAAPPAQAVTSAPQMEAPVIGSPTQDRVIHVD
ncbi:MAG TPA: hypothetical protein VG408_00800, partial [Actinomycetota bacterium]|nr:hypothetical protein [Actinomycetota bacterium]